MKIFTYIFQSLSFRKDFLFFKLNFKKCYISLSYFKFLFSFLKKSKKIFDFLECYSKNMNKYLPN